MISISAIRRGLPPAARPVALELLERRGIVPLKAASELAVAMYAEHVGPLLCIDAAEFVTLEGTEAEGFLAQRNVKGISLSGLAAFLGIPPADAGLLVERRGIQHREGAIAESDISQPLLTELTDDRQELQRATAAGKAALARFKTSTPSPVLVESLYREIDRGENTVKQIARTLKAASAPPTLSEELEVFRRLLARRGILPRPGDVLSKRALGPYVRHKLAEDLRDIQYLSGTRGTPGVQAFLSSAAA